jgi:hypothetical protein
MTLLPANVVLFNVCTCPQLDKPNYSIMTAHKLCNHSWFLHQNVKGGKRVADDGRHFQMHNASIIFKHKLTSVNSSYFNDSPVTYTSALHSNLSLLEPIVTFRRRQELISSALAKVNRGKMMAVVTVWPVYKWKQEWKWESFKIPSRL